MRYGRLLTEQSCPQGLKRPRAARYPFVASVALIDLGSGHRTMARAWDLSLFGCRVLPSDPSSVGTRVRLQIIYNCEVFEALGRVAHMNPLTGIGIAFSRIDDHDQFVLEKWLAELRNRQFREGICKN
jgi:hypothetical protein